jgi:micrococcal nuclease
VGKVVRFASRRGKGQETRRRRKRVADALWQSLMALVVVAGGLWLAAELYSSGVIGTGASARSASASFVLCAGAPRPDCVIDGDTIRMGGTKIRLADIDAPEVFSPKCASEAARGRRATERLLELINAGPFDVVHAGTRDEDRYGRKLRVIERGGRSLGATLVAEGLARPWDGARRSWCG